MFNQQKSGWWKWVILAALPVALSLVALLLYSTLAPKDNAGEPNDSPTPVQCRIIPSRAVVRLKDESFPFRLELVNTSDHPVEIRYGYWPHKNTALEVTDYWGRSVVRFAYYSLASIINEPDTLTLAPGEVYAHEDDLFRLIGRKGRFSLRPGQYNLRCTFHFRSATTKSEVTHFVLLAD
jgi:hypothetical protein